MRTPAPISPGRGIRWGSATSRQYCVEGRVARVRSRSGPQRLDPGRRRGATSVGGGLDGRWSGGWPGGPGRPGRRAGSRRSRSANRSACSLANSPLSRPSAWVGHGRGVADGAARVGLGGVEGRQDRHQQRPLDVDVDAPPGRLLGRRDRPALAGHRLAGQHLARDRRVDARAAGLRVQRAADGQDRVADLLGRRAGASANRQNQSVGRVLGQRLGRRPATTSGRRSRAGSAGASRLSRQPPSISSAASQSSSSGCVGGSPSWPKSFGRRTIPRPKWYCQSRLAITRAVSGLRAVGQPLRQGPPLAAARSRTWPCGSPRIAGTPGSTFGPTRFGLPRSRTCVSAWPCSRTHMTSMRRRRRRLFRVLRAVLVGHVVEEGQQAVVVALGDRVDLVVVAAGAVDRQAEEDLAGGRDDVVEAVVAGQRRSAGSSSQMPRR